MGANHAYYQPPGWGPGLTFIVPTVFSPATTPRTAIMMAESRARYFDLVHKELVLAMVYDVGIGVVLRPILYLAQRGARGLKERIKKRRRTTDASPPPLAGAGGVTIIGTPFRYADRDMVVVQTSRGPQLFYRRTYDGGSHYKDVARPKKGSWVPCDGIDHYNGGHIIKSRYYDTVAPGTTMGYGTPELEAIGEKLKQLNPTPTKDFALKAKEAYDHIDSLGASRLLDDD